MGVETTSIAANLERILERITRAAQRAGRKPAEITLVAVSKTFPAECIRQAYAAGVRHFGENRVQEWEAKQPLVADLYATWHLVGHLQSNKAARAARLFHTIDSLDGLALAQKLDRAGADLGSRGSELQLRQNPGRVGILEGQSPSAEIRRSPSEGALAPEGGLSSGRPGPSVSMRLPVLIEVRLAPEETKTGVVEGELPALAEAVLALPHLDLGGLMCIPPYCDDPEQVRTCFRKLRELREALRHHLVPARATPSAALTPAGDCHSEPRQSRGEESLPLSAPSSRSEGGPPEQPLLPELSMGMSHDFEVAIEEGATQVRLGTALFGPRQPA